MIDAGLLDNDLVIIDKDIQPKDGDIGAFLINNIEATVKSVSYTHLRAHET